MIPLKKSKEIQPKYLYGKNIFLHIYYCLNIELFQIIPSKTKTIHIKNYKSKLYLSQMMQY